MAETFAPRPSPTPRRPRAGAASGRTSEACVPGLRGGQRERRAIAVELAEAVGHVPQADAVERRRVRRPARRGPVAGRRGEAGARVLDVDHERAALDARARTETRPPPRFRSTPCLTAFSTSVWTANAGTSTSAASGDTSTSTSIWSPNRAFSTARYRSTRRTSSLSGTSARPLAVSTSRNRPARCSTVRSASSGRSPMRAATVFRGVEQEVRVDLGAERRELGLGRLAHERPLAVQEPEPLDGEREPGRQRPEPVDVLGVVDREPAGLPAEHDEPDRRALAGRHRDRERGAQPLQPLGVAARLRRLVQLLVPRPHAALVADAVPDVPQLVLPERGRLGPEPRPDPPLLGRPPPPPAGTRRPTAPRARSPRPRPSRPRARRRRGRTGCGRRAGRASAAPVGARCGTPAARGRGGPARGARRRRGAPRRARPA